MPSDAIEVTAGIVPMPDTGNRISGNMIVGFGNGVVLSGDNHNTISGNMIDGGSDEAGISLQSSLSDTVMSNTVTHQAQVGILLFNSSANTISKNVCNANEVGIVVEATTGNAATGNTLAGNTANDSPARASVSNEKRASCVVIR